jgi:hypothetical protein
LEQSLKKPDTQLLTGCKKPKGKDLTKLEKYIDRLIGKFRQPIENLLNWSDQLKCLQSSLNQQLDVTLLGKTGRLLLFVRF